MRPGLERYRQSVSAVLVLLLPWLGVGQPGQVARAILAPACAPGQAEPDPSPSQGNAEEELRTHSLRPRTFELHPCRVPAGTLASSPSLRGKPARPSSRPAASNTHLPLRC